jgi:ABC-2 type transport system permease protein
MSQFVTVYSAEIMRRLQSRAFIAGLLIGALGIVAMLQLPLVIDRFATQSYRVALAGDPQLIDKARPLLARDYNISATLPNLGMPAPQDLDAHQKLAAIIVFSRAPHGLRVNVYARDPSGISIAQLRRDLLPLNISVSTNLPKAQVAALLAMPVDLHALESKFGTLAQADAARAVAFILLFLLYLLIVLNSQLIMTSVAEEKTSRIAELLVASVSPSVLLAAKIASSATLAILQMILWVAIGLAFGLQAAAAGGNLNAHGTPPSLGGISANDVLGFVAFFLLGYLQISTLFAAVGSLINRTEDIGALGGPLFLPVVAAFFIAITALQIPDAPLVIVTSFIPIFSPFVMFARIAVSTVPLPQIAGALLINLVTIWGVAVLSGRIYRVGMLLYGRVPKFSQLWNAIKAA